MKSYIQLVPVSAMHQIKLPEYKTSSSSGVDLAAYIPANEDGGESFMIIKPQSARIVPTGLKIQRALAFLNSTILYEVQIRSRSGLAAKNNVFVLNSPGTIDADYEGEVGVILYNASDKDYVVNHGDRIAQAIVVEVADFANIDRPDTIRGEGGFGSTGV